jgi:hypothetical protein
MGGSGGSGGSGSAMGGSGGSGGSGGAMGGSGGSGGGGGAMGGSGGAGGAGPAGDGDDDGIPDDADNCPDTANHPQTDGDQDGVGDACDVCPDIPDHSQRDTDGDGVGDACEPPPDPWIGVDPPRLDFGRAGVGCGEQSLPVTITPTAAAPGALCLPPATLAGGDGCRAFRVSGGGACDPLDGDHALVVRFDPPAPGEYRCTLEVVVRAAGGEQTLPVDLAGEGTAGRTLIDRVQGPPAALDLLLIVDDSGSMSPYQQALSEDMPDLLGPAVEAGVDFHVGVVTTDMEDQNHSGRLQGQPRVVQSSPQAVGQFAANVQVGDAGSGTERGLDAMRAALTRPLSNGFNHDFRRPDVPLSIVIMGDEDDQSMDRVEAFIDAVRPLSGGGEPVGVHALTGVDDHGDPAECEGEFGHVERTPRYVGVVDAFDGRAESLCTRESIDHGVNRIAQALFGPPRAFLLPADAPRDENALEVRVDGQPVDHWRLDHGAVVFEHDAVPAAGSHLEVVSACP